MIKGINDIKLGNTQITKVYVGNDIVFNYIPPQYSHLSYIEAQGFQWIETGLQNTGDYIFEIDFLITDTEPSTGDGSWIIGGRKNPNYSLGIFSNNSGVFNAYGTSTKSSTPFLSANVWYTLYFSRNVLTITNKDSGVVFTYEVNGKTLIPEEYTTELLLCKNSINYAGTGDDPRNMWGYISSVKITDATTNMLIRDYVPRLETTTNKVGLYDNVNNVFKTSAGSEEFIGGIFELDKVKLNTYINYGATLTESKYTANSWSIFNNNYNQAITILNTINTTQEIIDIATDNLVDSIVSLVEITSTNFDYNVYNINLDGTNYIDTNIKLFDSDKDFTIIMHYKLDIETFADPSTQNALLHCLYEVQPWLGFVLQSNIYSAASNAFIAINYNLEESILEKLVALDVNNKTSECVIVIKKSFLDETLYVQTYNINGIQLDNSEIINKFVEGTYQNSNLLIGAADMTNGNIQRHVIGNIYNFEYYNNIFVDDEETLLKSLKMINK